MKHLIAVLCLFSVIGCSADVGKNKSDDLQNENTALKVENAELKLKIKRYARYCNPNTDKDCPIEGVF